MVDSEKLELTWANFEKNIAQSYKLLRQEEDFLDVTLVSEDEKQVKAHKLVLSACSSFFKKILKNSPHSHPLIYLSGVSSLNLDLVMDYVYQGEVRIYQDNLERFLQIADKLKLEGIGHDKDENTEDRIDFVKNSEDAETQEQLTIKSENENSVTVTTTPASLEREQEPPLRPMRGRGRPALRGTAGTAEVDRQISSMLACEKDSGRYYCTVCGRAAPQRGPISLQIATLKVMHSNIHGLETQIKNNDFLTLLINYLTEILEPSTYI